MARHVEFNINDFHLPLFYKDDFSWTWGEHGGLAGHIDYQKRMELRKQREAIGLELINKVIAHPDQFPVCKVFRDLFVNLYNAYQNLVTHGAVNPGNRTDIEYFLLSGFSRSGGTYLLDEYARMKGINVRNDHIAFSHDFFPNDLRRAAFDHHGMQIVLHNYFGALIAYRICFGRKYFYKRTTLGPLMIPYINELEKILPGLKVHWRHSIRDLHGCVRSARRMYATDKVGAEILFPAFKPISRAGTDFGDMMIMWFMCNTAILPSRKGLPFWDTPIALDDNDVQGQIERCLDAYLKENSPPDPRYYALAKPLIIKYGADMEERCNVDGQVFSVDREYRANRFNFAQVLEIDDRYSGIYNFLLIQLVRLYSHFGIVFDGKLDRV